MNKLVEFLKKPLVQASLIGAFGGMAPKIIELVPKLFENIYPSTGHLIALAILASIGGIIVLVYKEENFQKALILGAGAPAIIATLTTQAVAPKQADFILPFNFSFIAAAYAQSPSENDTIKFVVTQNESSFKLNSLWFRADSVTLDDYKQKGDTVIVYYPKDTKELRIDLPSQGRNLTIPVSELSKVKILNLKIFNDQQTKDFWETFGNKSIPKYKIEKAE